MSRALTQEEMQNELLEHIHNMITYWEREERAVTTREKLEGLAFSILVAIDGGTELPAYALIPVSSEADIAYYKEQGKNYYPENADDIAGCLHDRFHDVTPSIK